MKLSLAAKIGIACIVLVTLITASVFYSAWSEDRALAGDVDRPETTSISRTSLFGEDVLLTQDLFCEGVGESDSLWAIYHGFRVKVRLSPERDERMVGCTTVWAR